MNEKCRTERKFVRGLPRYSLTDLEHRLEIQISEREMIYLGPNHLQPNNGFLSGIR